MSKLFAENYKIIITRSQDTSFKEIYGSEYCPNKICGQNFSAEKCLLAADVLQCMFDKAEKLVKVLILSVLHLVQ